MIPSEAYLHGTEGRLSRLGEANHSKIGSRPASRSLFPNFHMKFRSRVNDGKAVDRSVSIFFLLGKKSHFYRQTPLEEDEWWLYVFVTCKNLTTILGILLEGMKRQVWFFT